MERSRIRAAIPGRYADQNVLGRNFGVFDENVKVAILGEDARVYQFILGLQTRPLCIFLNELIVGERPLWILVETLQIRTCGRGIQIEIVFLYVLAVIPLGVGQD